MGSRDGSQLVRLASKRLDLLRLLKALNGLLTASSGAQELEGGSLAQAMALPLWYYPPTKAEVMVLSVDMS